MRKTKPITEKEKAIRTVRLRYLAMSFLRLIIILVVAFALEPQTIMQPKLTAQSGLN